MRIVRRFIQDIRVLVRRRSTDVDLSDELDTFLAASVAHKMQSGMSREEATRTARVDMGSFLSFVVRTDGDPARLTTAMRSLIARRNAGDITAPPAARLSA